MSELEGYDKRDLARIKVLAREFIVLQIQRGDIDGTPESIQASLPIAFRDAKATISVVDKLFYR